MEVKGNFKKCTLNVLPNMNRYPRSTSIKFTCIPLNKPSNYFKVIYMGTISAIAMMHNSKVYPMGLRKCLAVEILCALLGRTVYLMVMAIQITES